VIPHGRGADRGRLPGRAYDFAALGEAIATAGNSAIPLVKALGKQIAARSAEAERYVHLGATSQDVMDSGLVLQLRQALELIESDLARSPTLATQAQRMRPRHWPGAPGCNTPRRSPWA
jgi:adenylosuccinate lyase